MQQPPNNQPWQQYPQQPYGQLPGLIPQPPKKSRRRLWIILSIIGGVLILSCVTCGLVAAFSPALKPTAQVSTPTVPVATATPTATQSGPTGTMAPTVTPTVQPTLQPTTQLTTSSGLVATNGTPLLGGLISDFIGKYGSPNDHSDSSSLHWLRDGSSNVDGLIVWHLTHPNQADSIDVQ